MIGPAERSNEASSCIRLFSAANRTIFTLWTYNRNIQGLKFVVLPTIHRSIFYIGSAH